MRARLRAGDTTETDGEKMRESVERWPDHYSPGAIRQDGEGAPISKMRKAAQHD